MTCREVWEQLVEEVTGQGREAPTRRSVHRWLKRWVEDGVLVLGGVVMEGPRKNKKTNTYLTPPIPPSRVGCEIECPLSPVGSNPNEEADLTGDTASGDTPSVPSSQAQLTGDTTDLPRERVPSSFPVAARDLTQLGTNAPISDTDIARTSASQDETDWEVRPLEGVDRTNGGQGLAKRLSGVGSRPRNVPSSAGCSAGSRTGYSFSEGRSTKEQLHAAC